jgi:tRNA(Ile)-lysidine synthase
MPGPLTDWAELWADLPRTGRVGLAVSGGADSLALMLLAARLPEAGDRFIVYSVDHRLRPEAGAEVAFVLAEADRLGLRARGLVWQDDKPETGLQAAARAARYRLIGAAMAEDGASVLATAHHARDQAETMLMRLAHGSGLVGLKGMARWSVVSGVTVYRPLLAADPEALGAIVRLAGLEPVLDPSNADRGYERVRWRALLPLLEVEGLGAERFVTLSRRLEEAMALIDAEAERAAPMLVPRADGGLSLDRTAFSALNPQVATRLMGRALMQVAARSAVPLGALEGLVRRLQSADSVAETLGFCVVRIEGNAIVILPEVPRRARALV